MARSFVVAGGTFDPADHGHLSGPSIALNADFDSAALRVGSALAIESLYAVTSNNTGTGRTLTLVKNAADSALVAAIADGNAPQYGSGSGSVSFVAGDRAALKYGGSASVGVGAYRATINNAGGNAIGLHQATAVSPVTFGVTNGVAALGGTLNVGSHSATVRDLRKAIIATPGTWRGLAFYMSANGCAGGDTVTVESRIDDVAGNQAVTIVASDPPGHYMDTTDTDALSVGSEVYYGMTRTGSGSISIASISSTIEHTGALFDMFSWGVRSATRAAAPWHIRISTGDPGGSAPASTAATREVSPGFAATAKHLRLTHGGNTSDAAFTATIYKNGSPTALTVSIAAGAASGSVSVTADVAFASTDLAQLVLGNPGATTGTGLSYQSHLIQWEDSSSAPITGSAALTFGTLTAPATGTVGISGQAAPAFGALTVTAAGALAVRAAGAPAFSPMSLASTGTLKINAAAGLGFAAVSTVSAARVAIRAAAAPTFAPLALAATGNGLQPLQGAATLAFGPLVATSTGVLRVSAQASLAFGEFAIGAEGAVPVAGVGALGFAPLQLESFGRLPMAALADLSFAALTTDATALSNFKLPGRRMAFIIG